MNKPILCIEDCTYLKPERRGHDKPLISMEPHVCTAVKDFVFHGPYHPYLIRHKDCPIKTETVSL